MRNRIIKTLLITWLYCIIWILLEFVIYGNVENSIVDNIIMLLFIPVIYKATNNMTLNKKGGSVV